MQQDCQLRDVISIGITTRNRWQDLQVTLSKIVDAGLGELAIFIYDDHSDRTCPFDFAALGLRNCRLVRAAETKGYIVRRNQLAKLTKTKYYLSLDDDSYPTSGSLKAAIDFAETQDDVLSLSFPVYNPNIAAYQNHSLANDPYQVRFFIGCGHLLHVERFLQLGGYREELIHQGEEMEIAARALLSGWYCYHFPCFTIQHNASLAGRNWYRMDFYGSRNLVLWNDWYVPKQLKWYKQSRTFISRFVLALRVRRLATLKGEIAGLIDILHYKKNRQFMSWQEYEIWQKLPIS